MSNVGFRQSGAQSSFVYAGLEIAATCALPVQGEQNRVIPRTARVGRVNHLLLKVAAGKCHKQLAAVQKPLVLFWTTVYYLADFMPRQKLQDVCDQ